MISAHISILAPTAGPGRAASAVRHAPYNGVVEGERDTVGGFVSGYSGARSTMLLKELGGRLGVLLAKGQATEREAARNIVCFGRSPEGAPAESLRTPTESLPA